MVFFMDGTQLYNTRMKWNKVIPPQKVDIGPHNYPSFSSFFQQTLYTKAPNQSSQFAFCEFHHFHLANLDHTKQAQC